MIVLLVVFLPGFLCAVSMVMWYWFCFGVPLIYTDPEIENEEECATWVSLKWSQVCDEGFSSCCFSPWLEYLHLSEVSRKCVVCLVPELVPGHWSRYRVQLCRKLSTCPVAEHWFRNSMMMSLFCHDFYCEDLFCCSPACKVCSWS